MDNSKQESCPKKSGGKYALILIAAVLILAAAAVFVIGQGGSSDVTSLPVEEKEEKNLDTIDIPGYELLNFEVGKTKQSIGLANPKQNTCAFVISLVLADGTQLWQSEEIKPGESSRAIVLSKALDAGTYPNTVLKYQCFRLDEQHTPLNGAETKLTVVVK